MPHLPLNWYGNERGKMKEHPIIFSSEMVRAILEGRKTMTRRIIKPQPCEGDWLRKFHLEKWISECPFGQTGDHLWVRETHDVVFAGYKDGRGRQIIYRATNPDWPYGWTPSIHMPRWASRITLEITNIRVERVQEITTEDSIKEGVTIYPYEDAAWRWKFRRLWDSINGKGAWERNDFVWVIEFKREVSR
jgi:hypothetical protein